MWTRLRLAAECETRWRRIGSGGRSTPGSAADSEQSRWRTSKTRFARLPERSTTSPGEAWKFIGKTESAESLCVVVGFDSEDPTIVTVWWVS